MRSCLFHISPPNIKANPNKFNKSDGYYLVTTANENSWDVSKKILFLGEWCCNYSKKLLHGEAVSIGICMASRLSQILGFLPLYDCEEIKKLFIILGLPTDLYFVRNFQIRTDDMIKHMMYDKKVLNGKLNFILCKKIGKTFVYNKVDVNSIKKSINMSLIDL